MPTAVSCCVYWKAKPDNDALMEFHRDTTAETNLVTGYGSEGIRIGADILRQPCIVAPDQVIEDWAVGDIATLTAEGLQPAVMLKPELILLGTGPRLSFPQMSVTRDIVALGIGFEVMDTAAACRTYNVLVHEGRRVVAALML